MWAPLKPAPGTRRMLGSTDSLRGGRLRLAPKSLINIFFLFHPGASENGVYYFAGLLVLRLAGSVTDFD